MDEVKLRQMGVGGGGDKTCILDLLPFFYIIKNYAIQYIDYSCMCLIMHLDKMH